jgi:hypothetical protein
MTRIEGEQDELSARASRAHRHLELVFEDVASSLAQRDDAPAVIECVVRLTAELTTHFDQEDRLYHPAIETLRPEHRERLGELRRAHAWFLDQLDRVGDRLRHADLDGAAEVFREMERAFRLHEAIEEALLASLE